MESPIPDGPFDIAYSAFLIFAILRAGWILVSGGDPPSDVWRRRWLEVIGLVVVGVLLFALGQILT